MYCRRRPCGADAPPAGLTLKLATRNASTIIASVLSHDQKWHQILSSSDITPSKTHTQRKTRFSLIWFCFDLLREWSRACKRRHQRVQPTTGRPKIRVHDGTQTQKRYIASANRLPEKAWAYEEKGNRARFAYPSYTSTTTCETGNPVGKQRTHVENYNRTTFGDKCFNLTAL